MKAQKKVGAKERELTMSFAGRLVKHLGLQMYSGAVPAIAELIANAWDAMAKNVYITIPLDKSLEESNQIVVKDDGHGMSFEECDNHYLVIGRDRRLEEGDHTKKYGEIKQRKLMSRKGIGKLSGFGISNRIEVRTVKDGFVTHFAMEYNLITRSNKFIESYHPDLLEDDGKKTDEPNGTTITLTQLKLTRAISSKSFRESMTRRFTILNDPQFSVFINGQKLAKEECKFQFRYPDTPGTWISEDIAGVGQIRWWIGFEKEPIQDEEARGIVVFTRGKMAQAPWFFGLSGGATGQHGMQYMTGEVIAEQLDLTEGQDFVATDRAGALWEEAVPAALKDWGEKKIRELLGEWAKERIKAKLERPTVSKYRAYAERLPDKDRKIFNSFVNKICSIPQIDKDKEILDELIQFGYNALTNYRFLEVIRQINAASSEDRKKVFEILSEWDIMEAVSTAQKVKGRVEIIRKFRQMIEDEVPEKPDMQDYIEKHPWLVNPGWESFKREKSIDNLLYEHFGIPKSKNKQGRRIPDYFSLGDSRSVYIIDLKRPGEKASIEDMDQIRDYVLYVRKRAENEATDGPLKKSVVGGLLICGKIDDGTKEIREMLKTKNIESIEWDYLLRTAETLHRDFLEVVKDRAKEKSPDDPRIEALDESDNTTQETTI
ncbi:MAG: ATP-binding protein [Candidatus Zixiibacteriota bacterium]